jgi:Ca-activated chloride channel homolog
MQIRTALTLSCFAFLVAVHLAAAQTASERSADAASAGAYALKLPVDEVSLQFHAADAHGLPVNDIRENEMKVLDNGMPARRMLAFYPMTNFPIRAGMLLDTSESMTRSIAASRAIAAELAEYVLRQKSDQAFVMDFGYTSNLVQDWTGNATLLTTGIGKITAKNQNPLPGTALLDTVFRACFYGFGKIDHAASGNFILVFTDGEDNESHTSLAEVVDICQQTNTAVYAFLPIDDPPDYSPGPSMLRSLAEQTGGRVFHESSSATENNDDLRVIEEDVRNQYRLVYKPAELKHNGSFHRIELQGPDRVQSIFVRTGYYAPSR